MRSSGPSGRLSLPARPAQIAMALFCARQSRRSPLESRLQPVRRNRDALFRTGSSRYSNSHQRRLPLKSRVQPVRKKPPVDGRSNS